MVAEKIDCCEILPVQHRTTRRGQCRLLRPGFTGKVKQLRCIKNIIDPVPCMTEV